MYCEYWNLHRAPFDNVPDPSMYADCHTSMENVITETIFAIKEANDSFAVIIGDAGLGKTLTVRILIDALEPHRFLVVLITNPGLSFTQLLREIIGQISKTPCDEKNKADLLERFNHLVMETAATGKKIVIFIDEANTISPANLENLRLLTNMQDDRNALFTLVLAGQMELARRLEHPKRANLFQRIGTYGRIDKLHSPDALKKYIETRLKLAGAKRKIFTDECIDVIWEYSDHGIPRLINKICKLCLKNGETAEYRIITPDIVAQVGDRFQKLSDTVYQHRKPRTRPDPGLIDEEIAQLANLMGELQNTPFSTDGPFKQTEEFALPDESQQSVEEIASAITPDEISDISHIENDICKNSEEDPGRSARISAPAQNQPESFHNDFIHYEAVSAFTAEDVDSAVTVSPESHSPPAASLSDRERKDALLDEDEIIVAGHIIRLNIPKAILKQVNSLNPDNANKSAGFWAAQVIKSHPELTGASSVDPVHIWNEIKDNILKRISS